MSCKKQENDKFNQLSENDVGITQYLCKLEGFSGIIKARYSDFHVNEIDLNGQVAKLTDVSVPKSFLQVTKNVSNIKDERIEQIPEDVWSEITVLIESDESNETKEVSFDVTSFTKEDRTAVHNCVKQVFGQKLIASTLQKDDKKYITFKKYSKTGRQDNRFKWPDDIPEYIYFLVYKESTDTIEASLKISQCLRMKAASFTYAGVKDKRAKTTQWFSARKVNPKHLLEKTKHLKSIKIGNIAFKDVPLKLGQLQGNQFKIALRNVIASDDLINNSMENLKNNGFINYYGLQRFGMSKDVPTFSIGIKLLQGNWKEACSLILKPKTSDVPFADLTKAKNIYEKTSDAKKATAVLKKFKSNSIESKLLFGLAKGHKNEYVNALESVPRNMRLLYLHSFQSLIWNKIVSKRIEKYKMSVLKGDLVLNSEYKETDSDEDTPDASTLKHKVKILTQEDVTKYTIYDIVLPLPGYDIIYPDNEIKEWYKEALEEYGLTLEMPKQSVKSYSLSGSYRKILAKVKNLSWKIIKYDDPNDNLIRSDYEELLGQEEPKDIPNGKYKAVVMKFDLDSSCYATMVLREVLKIDTSSSNQAKMNDYASPQSLLNNPEAYDLFKKSVFGVDDTKRKAEDDNQCDAKKLKTNQPESKEEKITIV